MKRANAFSVLAVFIIFLTALAFIPSETLGTVPQLINFQGVLKTPAGTAVSDGSYSVTFTIYDAPSGGTNLWTETQTVSTTRGLFAAILGSVMPLADSVVSGVTRYLGVKVGADPEMSPRTLLVSVPYAHRIATVDGASGGAITSKVSIGQGHINTGTDAFVAGNNNRARGAYSVVSGGGGTVFPMDSNAALGDYSVVGGGRGNTASGLYATVGGGARDTASGDDATVGGGYANTATAGYATVGGGLRNTAIHAFATVGGGNSNLASNTNSTIGGGFNNGASGSAATVGGGSENYAPSTYAAVGGGNNNYANANWATVSGGRQNWAGGQHATVPGGYFNKALGLNSFAAGHNAIAHDSGSIVISASRSLSEYDSIRSGGNEQMVLRADGGIWITNIGGLATYDTTKLINTSAGAYLTTGGTWTNASSKAYKTDIEPLRNDEYSEILEKLEKLDVVRFKYKAEPDREHIGLIAEDVPDEIASDDRKGLPTADAIAFLMAALKAQQAEIEKLEKRLKKVERR